MEADWLIFSTMEKLLRRKRKKVTKVCNAMHALLLLLLGLGSILLFYIPFVNFAYNLWIYSDSEWDERVFCLLLLFLLLFLTEESWFCIAFALQFAPKRRKAWILTNIVIIIMQGNAMWTVQLMITSVELMPAYFHFRSIILFIVLLLLFLRQ